MSPELILGEEEKGEGDYWALGVILFIMFAKSHPFEFDGEEKTKDSLVYNIVDYEVDWNKLLKSNISSNLLYLIQSLLTYEHKERLTSLKECKLHRYFDGIISPFIFYNFLGFDWDNVHKMPSPLRKYAKAKIDNLNKKIKAKNAEAKKIKVLDKNIDDDISKVNNEEEKKEDQNTKQIISSPINKNKICKQNTYRSIQVDNLNSLNNTVIINSLKQEKNYLDFDLHLSSSDDNS